MFFNQEEPLGGATPKSEENPPAGGEEIVDDLEFEKTAIALWLLDSNKTKTSIQEIKDYTRTKTFKEAKERIWKLIKNNDLDFVLRDIELPLIPIFKKMKKNGIKLNLKYLKSLSTEYTKKLNILEKEIYKQTGEEFNINSPKQLSEVLFEKMNLEIKSRKKTPTGMRSTKESELQKMIEVHPVIENILKYRELKKLLSTYIDNLPELADEKGFVHATFLQTGTTTGRISSNQPNLQNIPVRTEQGRKIRGAFEAQEGFDLFAFDYSQVELRAVAMLSGDENMIEIFKKGNDVHSAVASKIFGVPLEKVNSSMRRKAKIVNFGMIYGMGVNSLRQNMEDASEGVEKITRKEAQEFYNRYFETFKTVAEYLEGVKKEALKNGYTKTFFGRLRYFEGINSKIPFIRAMAERMAINAPVQGTSADILKIAMVRIDKYLVENKLEKKIKMLLQVHDELIFEVEKKVEEKHILKIKEIMETIIPLEQSEGIVFEVNIKKGSNWNSLTSLEY